MEGLLYYLKDNKTPIIMAMMVIASVFASISFGQYAYFAAMGLMTLYCIAKSDNYELTFFGLLGWILLGMVLNGVYPIQFVYFVLMLMASSPLFSSYDTYILRTKLLYALCLILPIVTILNLYAYHAGINYFVMLMTLERVAAYNFSGFLHHPMWLGAINGMSNVVLLYLYYKQKDSKWIIKGGIIALLVLSLYLSVIAASRSALASSLLAMAIMVYFQSTSGGKFVRAAIVIGILGYIILPFLTSNSEAMSTKMANEAREGSSRSVAWSLRLKEFMESPIWGVGFGSGYTIFGYKTVGTLETGSGWLTILSQTGLIGALFFVGIIKRAYVSIKEIKEEGGLLILFACLFIYLCAHSVFEGYIYTAGYCPCMFFWLTLCFFYEYNKYGYPEEVEDEYDEEEEDDDDEDEDDDDDDDDEDDDEEEDDDDDDDDDEKK